MRDIRVLHEVPKHKGVDLVVRLVEIDGEKFIDIRDRVDGGYGRGYLIPASLLDEVTDALVAYSTEGD